VQHFAFLIAGGSYQQLSNLKLRRVWQALHVHALAEEGVLGGYDSMNQGLDHKESAAQTYLSASIHQSQASLDHSGLSHAG
jgi:hypothetical protein